MWMKIMFDIGCIYTEIQHGGWRHLEFSVNKKSQSNLGKAASPPFMTKNGLACCMYNAQWRRVQSLSRQYATSTPQYECHIDVRTCAQLPQDPHWLLQWDMPTVTHKMPLPFQRSSPTSNTAIFRPTPLTTLNGIHIQSAVFPQFIHWTDRQTDRHADWLGDNSVSTPAYADEERWQTTTVFGWVRQSATPGTESAVYDCLLCVCLCYNIVVFLLVTFPIDDCMTSKFQSITSAVLVGVQPCVNGDTSFQWEVLWLSAFFREHPWGSDPSTDRNAKWLKRRGFGQGCAFCIPKKTWILTLHQANAPTLTRFSFLKHTPKLMIFGTQSTDTVKRKF